MMVSTVEATSKEQPNSKWDYYHNDEPISFNERGIKFYIFPDGQMDFDIHANEQGTTTEYYYKSNRNNARNGSYQRGTKVVRDYRGRVIRVGRVFINYNYKNKVSRIGSVFISYRRNLMTKVGGLRLVYDRYGNVKYIGRVKHRYHSYYHNYYQNYYHNYYHNYYQDYFYDNYVYDYDDNFFFNDDFGNEYEQFNEDEDYYYYRSKGKTTKTKNGKKEVKRKMLKRKKEKSDFTTSKPKKQTRARR